MEPGGTLDVMSANRYIYQPGSSHALRHGAVAVVRLYSGPTAPSCSYKDVSKLFRVSGDLCMLLRSVSCASSRLALSCVILKCQLHPCAGHWCSSRPPRTREVFSDRLSNSKVLVCIFLPHVPFTDGRVSCCCLRLCKVFFLRNKNL